MANRTDHRIEIINRNPTAESTAIGFFVLVLIAIAAWNGVFSGWLPEWSFFAIHGDQAAEVALEGMGACPDDCPTSIRDRVRQRILDRFAAESPGLKGVFTFTALTILWQVAGAVGAFLSIAWSGLWWVLWLAGYAFKDIATGVNEFWRTKQREKDANAQAASLALEIAKDEYKAAEAHGVASPVDMPNPPPPRQPSPFTQDQAALLLDKFAGRKATAEAIDKLRTEVAEVAAAGTSDWAGLKEEILELRESVPKPKTTTRKATK